LVLLDEETHMRSLLAVALIGGLALVGCKKEEPKPVPPATPTPTPQAQPAPAAALPAAKDAVKEVQAQGQAVAADAARQVRTAVDANVAQGRAAVDAAVTQGKGAVDAAAAQAQTPANTNDLTTLATTKLDDAVKYIKENKLDLAEKAVTELENRKASLPASLQQRVGDVRKLLDTAKAGNLGGLSLPKL
jgi:hypothetical protein